MKRVLIVLAVILLVSGCAARLGFQFGSTGKSATEPSVGPGGSFSSGGVGARFGEGGAVGGIFGAGILGALFGSEMRGREARGTEARALPELDSSRRINEQDCGQPLENPSANLRCK